VEGTQENIADAQELGHYFTAQPSPAPPATGPCRQQAQLQAQAQAQGSPTP
jgi:hypothetical protein